MKKTRKCKYCRSEFIPYTTLQKNCFDPDCVTAWINDVKTKQWTKKKAQLKKDLMNTSDYLKIAQQVFNKYIRLRDQGLNCISCGKEPKKENAGHYFSQGGHSNVRFDEDNVHLQCEHCNSFLSGNLLNYQIGIEQRIGADKLIELHARAHDIKKWSAEELKGIISVYKEKIKKIEKN